MQPFSGNQRPPTALMNMSLVLHLPRKMQLCRSSSNVPRLPSFFGNARKPSRFAHFWQGAESLAPATQNDASTSKSGANMRCFVHFDFEMCFAPQRACTFSFEHLNFQKCSECGVFCTVLTWQCASRHNGVHFSNISTSKSAPNPLVFNTF